MGAQASRDAGAAAADPPDERLEARAWRTGAPFTLLHDEGFVVEKYQELLAASSAQPAAKAGKALEEAQTTVSGLDEAPMDELQHATDMARIKLFARVNGGGGGAGEQSASRPGSPSASTSATSSLTSSAAKENPPSALARMVGNPLSRESPESVESEKLRAQRVELLQIYFQQVAARMKQRQMETETEATRDQAAVLAAEGSDPMPAGTPIVAEGRKISQDVTAASIFSVASLRMQLEMLREFRVLSPRLFEKGAMALVQTLLDSPPFALRDIGADSPEDTLLNDVHRFCKDILHPEQEEQSITDVQRQVTLLVLLALGVSSGRISLLLEFVDELLVLPYEAAVSALPVQGHPFSAWVRVFMTRMQSYRTDFALGTFEDDMLVRSVAVKVLPGETDSHTPTATENETPVLTPNLPSSSVATDGSFTYTWSLSKGLAKIGTGLNFTIAGRVYAEIPARVYLGNLEEKRIVRKLVYGFGKHIKDVSEVAREHLRKHSNTLSIDSSCSTVQAVFGAAGQLDGLTTPPKLLLSVDVRICRAWYGDLDVLSNEALLEFCQLLQQKKSMPIHDSDEKGILVTNDLLEQLITASGLPPEKIEDSKKLMVIFGSSNSELLGGQILDEGDRFVDQEERAQDAYLSSLLYCGGSLYLNVMYPERDVSGMLTDETTHRCRQLLQISPQDLSFLEAVVVEDASPSIERPRFLMPLYFYATEGKLIYEINMAHNISVSVITPKTALEEGKKLVITRQFILNEKAIQCSELLIFLAKIRSTVMTSNDKLDVQLPYFYTNGASLGILVEDPNAEDISSTKNRVHCVLFDCESGAINLQQENGESLGCSERSLPRASVCFDARNNMLWLYDERQNTFRTYKNSGKRIPLDENSIPSDSVVGTVKNMEDKEGVIFVEAIVLSLLGIMYRNAMASDSADEKLGQYNSSLTRIPFAIDVEVDTFKYLLSFTSKYVDIFKTNEVKIVQAYTLQACLGILNKNLEYLLVYADGRRKQDSISLLTAGLSAPLDKLLEFSSEDHTSECATHHTQASPRGSTSSQIDERSRVQVASVALDLYTTSIRIFHSDVTKQFTHVLKYLHLWQQATATRMELKILARLLAHLCTRVDAIYQSMVASDAALAKFLKLVEFAVRMQQQQLRLGCVDSEGVCGDAAISPHTNESPFELISLVNAITQSSFVALTYTEHMGNHRAFDVAVVVFNTLRDACSTIFCELADKLKQRDCQAQWLSMESALKDGFVGVLAPVVLSSGIMFLRNREKIEALISISCKDKSKSKQDESLQEDDVITCANNKMSCISSRLVKLLEHNSPKLRELMTCLDVIVSSIEPTTRERVVENISMALKTEVMESSHEYENNMDALTELQIPGATRMMITFDPRSRTEVNYDYVTFYKDKNQAEYYGNQFYSGRDAEHNWPGVGDNPPLIIDSDRCFVYFHSDGSNTDWGYKFTATAEILEKKKSLQQHWIVFLLESIVQLLDESIKLLVDGSVFAPIEEIEIQNEQYLQSDLLKSGVCTEENKNAEVLQLLQDFADPPECSSAEKVIHALQERSGLIRPALALARSSSFDHITSSAPNKSVNSAVRAVAAAILHHNMWGMDAYAFTQNLRDDISEQLVRGWKNAQKMRDWFHIGDAADAGIHGQMVPNRRRSGRLRRQPSAYKGLSEESLAILCDNVIERARFLLDITPVSFAYVTGAKRRWGLLAKYGHAIGKQASSDTQLDKWYNLLDELQAATELRSLFQYRRSCSERLKHGQVKSVTEQVLEFIQSDVDVAELRIVIAIRNQRAASRALGMKVFIESLKDCLNPRLRGILLESFASTLKCFAVATSPTNIPGSNSVSSTLALDSFPRLHFDTLLSGCDESLRQQIAGAFGNCLAIFAKQLASTKDDGTNSGLITGILRSCALDYDLEDSYLLQESQILPQILRLLSSNSVSTRNAAQSLLSVLLSRFIAGRVESSPDEKTDTNGNHSIATDIHDISAFQRQLFSAVGHQLDGIVSTVMSSLNSSRNSLGYSSPQYLPDNSPGFTAPCLHRCAVSWNHSILIWVYCPSTGPLYALKLGDEVRRGPNWTGDDDTENNETEIGTVISIPTPTKVQVRWNSSGLTSQCGFDPRNGIYEVVLVDEGVGGTIFFKGNKNMINDSSAAKPWSHFGLFLTDKRMLVYKIACGSDKESVFETDYEMDADQWSHIAIVQDEDILKLYVNGSMISQHLLESFLVLNANVNPAESAIIESAHPLEDSIDEYCPVHIPGAIKIRLTFDPLCDIDGSTGFVRFYKDATCVEYWGEFKYTGKYSDPERNFPGAQSNRARSLQQTDDPGIDLNVLEIPSDRFLVYFHNEGSSNSWGFRILASPEFAMSGEEVNSPVSHLNPYPFYFGEAPGRVLDESSAKCWIYQPKVLQYPVSENDLTAEIQANFPSSDVVSNCVPAERTLHILGLIRTCAETSFGRSLIGTAENLRNLMFLSFDDRVPVEIRIGGIRVLKDLAGILSAEEIDAQLTEALPREKDGFLTFIFKRLGRALNVWSAYDHDEPDVSEQEDDTEGSLLELRTSAQGEASLVAAYISLIRGAAEFSCWGGQLFELMIAGLGSVQELKHTFSEQAVNHVLASLALLGGNYGGAYIGGRVSCCVNVDGKEMIETGYLVQFRVKSGAQIARVIFDCDQSSTVDVPLVDVAYFDDVETVELATFIKRVSPFASELRDLLQSVLDLSDCASLYTRHYQPKITKKENVEVLESEHPYAAGEDVTYSLNFRGASEIVVRFDQMSSTAGPSDYIQFKKREGDTNEGGRGGDSYWGEERYYGDSFPGVGAIAPLCIPAGSVDVHFCTDGSSNGISDWGFKLTAHAYEEALSYPPEIPPPILASALTDIRARCIRSIRQVIRSQKRADIVPVFVSLLPSLTKIANAPCDGRPIQSSPKSQIFESKHPYANSVMEYMKVTFSGASVLTITFDPQSRTEQGCDYLCFFKDKSLTDRWGVYQYCGVGSDANWPGVDDRPPLVIPADSFTLLWTTDGSNVDWGWKFNVTAEFLPEFPLDKTEKHLDARSSRLFETLYEKMNHQRVPLKSEFEEFADNGDRCEDKQTPDLIRQLLSTRSSCHNDRGSMSNGSLFNKLLRFRVTNENGLQIYKDKNPNSDVLFELENGTEFCAEPHPNGWLRVESEDINRIGKVRSGWAWQRTGECMHASYLTGCANGEDLLTLGVDDLNFEMRHSVLEMDESNVEEKLLTGLCSPFAFDEFKGQTDRIQSLAYDTHRAMATKVARDAILIFLTCDSNQAPISLGAFGDSESILLLLSHFFTGTEFERQPHVLHALRKRLRHMVIAGNDDLIISEVLVRCLTILSRGPTMLPKGRGAVRILESTHPYQDNADQYWDVSIPGAKKIMMVFDRRCKSEAGCDWLRFYKAGSNRSETIGPDQIGGRGDSENWPGTGGRPPLYIDGDSFEVYFHSDSSNNDWGFKLYAIGIFKEDETMPESKSDSCKNMVKLLSMACWILEVLSSVPDDSFRASPKTFKKMFSAETLQKLVLSLDRSPLSIKTCVLELLGNMSQSAAFHTIPSILIEQVRDLLHVKMRAKYQAEDRVEVKSTYLQTLVQCAVAIDLSIDSRCFKGFENFSCNEMPLSVPYQPGKDGVSTYMSGTSTSAAECMFQLVFNRLVSEVRFGLIDGAYVRTSRVAVLWRNTGETMVRSSDGDTLVEIPGYKCRIREGDTVTIHLDALRHITFRKNGIVAALIAGPTGSGALVAWESIHPSLCTSNDVRLAVSNPNAENRIEVSLLKCSPVAVIPPAVVPKWYDKILDAVGMMVDFHNNLSSAIVVKESQHPLVPSTVLPKESRENIDINGAVALEIRFDERTKLQKSDQLRFFGVGDESPTVFTGINGEIDKSGNPHLFAPENAKHYSYSLAIGDLVIRSPDWEYSDEDGGAGSVGIVQEFTTWGSHAGKGLRVRWQENGFENVYRYGFNGRYDVQNVESIKHHSSPFIIKGNMFSYEFVPTLSQTPTKLDFTAAICEFGGSLELDGSVRLDLNLLEENECVLSKGDCSLEFWVSVGKSAFNVDQERAENDSLLEVFRIGGVHGRIILLCDQAGKCKLNFQTVDASGKLLESHQGTGNAENDNGSSGTIVFGQWVHLALVFSGPKVSVVMNGDEIYSSRCSRKLRLVLGLNPAIIFGESCDYANASSLQNGKPSLPFRGHIYDIRLWDVAFRVEQLRSHFRGLDSVDVTPRVGSRPGTPTSATGKPQSPSMMYLASPRSPRASLRPVAVPQHLRKWVTTNRSSEDTSSVRLNCSVNISTSSKTEDSRDTIYYEAHALSSGKMCVGWILGDTGMQSRSAMIGQEHHSFGIELSKKLAHFSGSVRELAQFTRIEPSGCTSPRRSIGANSFANDIFCRSGDVIGCALSLSSGKLTFCVNGDDVAECALFNIYKAPHTNSASNTDSTTLLGGSKDHEFDVLVNEIIAFEKPSVSSTSYDTVPLVSQGTQARFYPAASLSHQGAQGLAWNFGQRPFKYEPNIDNRDVLSFLQASGCTEEDVYFEVYDHGEHQWDRVVYRHKLQDISPGLVGWWKLNEGVGNTVDDASGSNHQGTLSCSNTTNAKAYTQVLEESEKISWWNENCPPPAAARRRAGDGNAVSPFFSFGSNSDTSSKSESLWGYKFYVIPHFSEETVGRRRFLSPSVRFGDSPRNLLPRHDQQLVKYINKKGQSKNMTVTQLLHGSWSDLAPQENELVRWPALVEIVTATGDESTAKTTESKQDPSRTLSEPLSIKSVADTNGRLSKRFQVLQEFNAAIYRILPFIAFHAPSVDINTPERQFLLSTLLMEHRHRILSAVKRTVWDSAIERTNEGGVSFELTLNRPKAMRFRASGKTDIEGRHTLFSQAFRQLQSLDSTHFRRADALYHVTFLGENAQDAGGPYRETFAQYCEELQSTQLSLMLPTPNSQHNVGVGREKWLLSPGAQSSSALQMLEFLGKLMGASIRSKQYLALNLAPTVWKKLAGERLGLDDLAAVDSMLVNSMSKMRTIDRYGVTEEMFEDIVMETFTTLGADNHVIELKPGGAHLPVTFSSRCEYADLVEQARLHESDDQAQAIFRGLAKVVPAKLLVCFSGAELELMVCGSPEVDVDLLEKCTEYSSCSQTDDHIIWFWRALRDFSHEARSAFLRFVWGRSRLPASADEFPQRFKLQSFNQQRAGRSVDAYMPVAHTCFFSIEVPAYSSESVLREKLLYAMYNCQEIDGDGDSVAANQLGWEE
ncbi:unnamed protein product [Phytophthora fragariaefolia]|uniref:Unnamed protein product n=1 Tax=Phytophthora fragariaefolia TaxID=1490495 RepID=A0A9W7CZ48_9STRA|nr:unnamed protein product [Phytophthora fragariaefolia]